MTALLRFLVSALPVLMAVACTGADGQGHRLPIAADGRLASAREGMPEREVLVTVPLADQEAMDRTGRELAATHGLSFVAEWPLKSLGLHCFVFRAGDEGSVPDLLARLRLDGRIDGAEPMRLFQVNGRTYDDPYLPVQEGLKDLGALRVHPWATGAGVRVALIDTGVDVGHVDLAGRFAAVGNFVGDVARDSVAEAHGTALAGVIAARADNREGIVGVAPDARLLALRACWQEPGSRQGVCSSFTLARALNFALLNQARIINLSLQGPYDPLLARLIEHGLAAGVTVIAAHADGVRDDFPASLEGVIPVAAAEPAPAAGDAVSSEDASLQPARGLSPLLAPGTDILSTVPDNGYDFFSGSSLAAAHVSGLAALVLERAPGLTSSELHRLLAGRGTGVGAPPASGRGRHGVHACLAFAQLPGMPMPAGPGPCP